MNEQISYVPVGQPAPNTPSQPSILEKQIQITQIGTPRVINYNDKKTGQPKTFTVYEIYGNDGIKYEVSNEVWMKKRSVGENILIKYQVISNTGPTGQVYTNYRIMLPSFESRIDILEAKVDSLMGIKSEVKPLTPVNETPPAGDGNPVGGGTVTGPPEMPF